MRRHLVSSRDQARVAISSGRVLVGGAPADKASRLVGIDEPVVVQGDAPRFVSRGGVKLDAALDHFGVDVGGCRCLDAGASTGGFTDCLLQRGAAFVTAVDVGRAQLHEHLRADGRVRSLERTDIRKVSLGDLGGSPCRVIVADLSFISLRLAAPSLLGELAEVHADVITLVKPQFEAGRAEVSRGKGVVREPAVWREVLVAVISALEHHGAAMMGIMVSPLTGADGNVEFLAHLRAHAGAYDRRALDHDAAVEAVDAVDAVVEDAIRLHGRAG